MKTFKYVSLLMIFGAIVLSSFSLNNVKAATINTTDISNPGIARMQQKVHEKYNNLKTVSTKTEYLKIQNVSKDPNVVKTKVTAYTKSQYGWIVLTLEIDNSYRNNGTYDIYGFFNGKNFRHLHLLILLH